MLKTLWAQVGRYKKQAVLTPLFTMGEAVLEIAVPLVMASIIDDGIEAGNIGHVYRYGALMVGLAALGLLAGILAGSTAATASSGFAANLRAAMFRNIQEFSFANIDKYSTAGLVTRLTTDVTNVQNAFQMMMRMAVRAPAMMIASAVMAVKVSPRMSVIFLVALICLIIVLPLLMIPTGKLFRQVFRKYDDLNASVQENVSAIRVVKSFVREGFEGEKFRKAAENLYELFVWTEKKMVLVMPVMMIAVYGCNLAISWYGAHYILDGSLTTGDLSMLFSYVMSILMSLMMLSMVFVMITMSAASAQRIVEVLGEKSDITSPENACTEVADGSVDFENVSFAYRQGSGKPVLQNIDLHIRSGETIGIIGGTGSGKSSLVNLIPRFYDATEGRVEIMGRDIRSYPREALRGKVAVVMQKAQLFGGTIRSNLLWGRKNASDEELWQALETAQAAEFVRAKPLGLDEPVEQGGRNLSGGQKQRLTIARALVGKPDILILDDSASALDYATDAALRKALAALPGRLTVFIVSQRAASLQHADQILVLDDGKLVGLGKHADLLASCPVYEEIYASQFKKGDAQK